MSELHPPYGEHFSATH